MPIPRIFKPNQMKDVLDGKPEKKPRTRKPKVPKDDIMNIFQGVGEDPPQSSRTSHWEELQKSDIFNPNVPPPPPYKPGIRVIMADDHIVFDKPFIEKPRKKISADRKRVAVGGIFDGPTQQYRYYSPERVSKYNTRYRDTKYVICGEKQRPPPPVKPDQIFGPPIQEPKHKNRSIGSGKETKFLYDMLHGCDQPPTYKARVNRTSDSSQVLNTLSGTFELPVSPIKASRDHGNIIAWA